MNRFGLKYFIAFDYFGLEVKKWVQMLLKRVWILETGSENGYEIVKKGYKYHLLMDIGQTWSLARVFASVRIKIWGFVIEKK